MASNCLAPAYAQVTYTSNLHEHVMRLALKNVDSTVANVLNKGGTSVDADTDITTFLTLAAAAMAVGDVFSGVEYFTQANCASAPVFKRSFDLGGGIAGTSGAADVQWAQFVMTFKTTLGGRYKFQMMECPYPVDQKIALSIGVDSAIDALTAYFLSNSCIVAAYDGGYPSVALNFISKTNDQLRKKYLSP